MSEPVDVSIERKVDREIGSDLVVITARDNVKVIAQLEIPVADFARALVGGETVVAALSPGRR